MEQKTKHRTEISNETHEIRTVRIRGGLPGVCPVCGSANSKVTDTAPLIAAMQPTVPTREEHENETHK